MNKRILSVLVLAGVASGALLAQPKTPPPDYFPVPVGATWEYHTTTSMNTEMDMTRKVIDVKKQADGTYAVQVDAMTPDVTHMDYTKGNGWVLLHKTVMSTNNYTMEYSGPKKELMNPLKVGQTWDYKGKAGGYDIIESSQVTRAEKVKVPAGEFDALVVETHANQGGNEYAMTQWYVNHVGAVKITTTGAMSTTTELVKYSLK